MRAFVTGGTGFIGGHLVRQLRERGDEVRALVRTPSKAGPLLGLGCELVEGDLDATAAMRTSMDGCHAVFHSAAIYKVGIPASECPAMHEVNVRGTERVLDAAIDAGVPRIVYVSTVNVFGNTYGEVVDETYRRPGNDFLSCYDRTKYLAHEAALKRIERGAPIVIAQPGGVYGPGDHSEIGGIIEQMRKGTLRARSFPGVGFNSVHVEDAAAGIALVHDRGTPGQSYVLGGELTTLGQVVDAVAALVGRKPPRITFPSWMVKASVPLAPIVTRVMGLPPNLRELINVSDGVTYWATDAKARRELGYAPRGLDAGLRQTLDLPAA